MFSPLVRNKARKAAVTILYSTVLEVPVSAARQPQQKTDKTHKGWKGASEITFICRRHNFAMNASKTNKVYLARSGYRVNMQKLIIFLYTSKSNWKTKLKICASPLLGALMAPSLKIPSLAHALWALLLCTLLPTAPSMSLISPQSPWLPLLRSRLGNCSSLSLHTLSPHTPLLTPSLIQVHAQLSPPHGRSSLITLYNIAPPSPHSGF